MTSVYQYNMLRTLMYQMITNINRHKLMDSCTQWYKSGWWLYGSVC